jgi:hypothetical protein
MWWRAAVKMEVLAMVGGFFVDGGKLSLISIVMSRKLMMVSEMEAVDDMEKE